MAMLRNALGGALKSLGRFDEAAPLFEAALATFRAEASAAADPRAAISLGTSRAARTT